MPSKGKKKIIAEYTCPTCNREWINANSRADKEQRCHKCEINVVPHTQFQSTEGKTPYQGKRKTFGMFKCPTCERTWSSPNSWANCGQGCKTCKINVYPHTQVPLEKSSGINNNDPAKRHPQELCQKCKSMGHFCGRMKNCD